MFMVENRAVEIGFMSALTSDLLEQFKSGDSEAFRRIIVDYQAKIYRLGLRLFAHTHDAADFTQDVFIHVYEKRAFYDLARAFEPWLFKVAVNFGRSRLRRRFLKELLPGDTLPEVPVEPTAEQELMAAEKRQRVWSVVERLPYKYREIIALRYESGLSMEELAQVLNIPVGTVKSQLNRGLKKFSENYKA